MGQVDFMALFVAIPIVLLTVTFILAVYKSLAPDPDHLGRADAELALGLHSKVEWGLTIGFALAFVMTGLQITIGIFDLEAVRMVINRFGEWGYSETFALFIGASEVLAAILLIPRQTSVYAAGYLVVLMGGSIYTHVAHGDWGLALVPFAFLIGLVIVGVDRLKHVRRGGGSEEAGRARVPA